MKYNKIISLLVVCIVILSIFASAIGIFSSGGPGAYEIQSFRGEIINIYGRGLYSNDSMSVATQGIAQDIVTVALGIPLLILSLFLSLKDSLKGRLLLTGTLGYFLYTYISYVFLWMYNPMFIVYAILMSASFFTFTLSMMSFELSGVLLIKRKPFGYLLSSVIIMKGFTMGAALTAMIIGQYLAGVSMSILEIIIFPLFSLIIFYCMLLLIKNIDDKGYKTFEKSNCNNI